jgi:hypothetical protein
MAKISCHQYTKEGVDEKMTLIYIGKNAWSDTCRNQYFEKVNSLKNQGWKRHAQFDMGDDILSDEVLDGLRNGVFLVIGAFRPVVKRISENTNRLSFSFED